MTYTMTISNTMTYTMTYTMTGAWVVYMAFIACNLTYDVTSIAIGKRGSAAIGAVGMSIITYFSLYSVYVQCEGFALTLTFLLGGDRCRR